MADAIIPVEKARSKLSVRLIIRFSSGKATSKDIDKLFEVARNYPGDCSLVFHLPNNSGSNRPLRVLAHNIKVSTDKDFIRQLRKQYGKDNVWVE